MDSDVVVQLHDAGLFRKERRAEFFEGPGEIIAVVIEGIISVLAGVEAAVFLVGQDVVNPANDAFGGFAQEGILRGLPDVEIILQELGIVVGHFFEVGDEPTLIDGIAVKTAGELIVDAAASHFFEGGFGHGEEMFFLGLLVALEDEVASGSVGKFRGAAEAAVFYVKEMRDGVDLGFDDAGIEIGAGSGEDLGVCDGLGERFGGAFQFGAFVAERIGDGEKHAPETGAVHLVFGREIGAAEKRFAVGEKESGERPAALFGNRADGGLVAGIHIGTLVAVDFDGHETVVDDFRDFGILVAFAVDDMAPVAPDGTDIEEDRFVFRLGASKSGIVPFVPVNRLVRGGAQVGAGGIFQAVFRMVGQSRSQFEIAKEGRLRSFASLRMTLEEKSTGLKTGHYKSYWTVSPGARSRGSSGLRPAKP